MPSAAAILAIVWKLRLLSPRSTVPMKVRWTPHSSAKPSCEKPRWVRSSRILCPKARNNKDVYASSTSTSVWELTLLRLQYWNRHCLRRCQDSGFSTCQVARC